MLKILADERISSKYFFQYCININKIKKEMRI